MYVIRDSKGNILGWSDVVTDRATEFVPDDDPALVAEITRRAQDAAKGNANEIILAQLAVNDLKIIRSLNDISIGNGNIASGNPPLTPNQRVAAYNAAQSALRAKLVI